MGATQNPLDDPDSTTGGEFAFGDEKSGEDGRKLFSREGLMRNLSTMIQTCEGCEKVSVVEVTRLDVPDTSGCNWSTSVVLDPADTPPEVYSLGYATIVFMARTSWNLEE
jgi:hypothetical protein